MLEQRQAAITATLLHGPGHLPADLFAGSDAAVLRGLRVHANTISQARLVALEETFQRTRDYSGEEEFNRTEERRVGKSVVVRGEIGCGRNNKKQKKNKKKNP